MAPTHPPATAPQSEIAIVWQRAGGSMSGTTMLIALSAVFVGIKQHRDVDRGGVIGFWSALAIGLGISFIAGIFYVVAWEAVQAMTQMDFASAYSQAIIASEQANGASAEALAKLSADMEAFKVQGLEVGHPCAWTGSWTHMRITAGCSALSVSSTFRSFHQPLQGRALQPISRSHF